MSGSVARTAGQFMVLILVSNKIGINDMGRYAYCLALTAPIFTLCELGLRSILVSVSRAYPFSHYLGMRCTAVALALLVCLTAGLIQNSAPLALIMVIALVKAIDSVSDIIAARLQRDHALAYVGLAGVVNGAATLVAMFTLIELTGSVVAAVLASAGVSLVANTIVYWVGWHKVVDLPMTCECPAGWRQTWSKIFPSGAAYGLAVSVASLTSGIPLYLLAHYGTAASVGQFAPLVYFSTGANLIFNSVGQSLLPRWAITLATLGAAELRRSVVRAIMVGFGAAGLIALLVAGIGPPMIKLSFGVRFDSQWTIFALIAFGVLFTPLAIISAIGTLVLNKYGPQLMLNAMTLVVAVLVGLPVVQSYGLLGAALVVATVSLGRGLAATGYFLVSARTTISSESKHGSRGLNKSWAT